MVGNVLADFSEQFDRTQVPPSLTMRVDHASNDDELDGVSCIPFFGGFFNALCLLRF